MKATRRTSGGFTLAELMVVIVIIGVLMALLLPAILRSREGTTATAVKTKMHTIGLAIDSFQRDFGYYPPTTLAFNPDPSTGGQFNGDSYGDFGYSEALVQCLCNRFTKGAGDAPGPGVSVRGTNRLIGNAPVTAGPYLEVKPQDLADKDGDGFPELVDAWNNAFIFVPRDDYFHAAGSYRAGAQMWADVNKNNQYDGGDTLGNHYQRFTYQLISLGQDGWTPGLYSVLEAPRNYLYFDVTIDKGGNPNPAPWLVGQDDMRVAPMTDAVHTSQTADDLNNWGQSTR